jgi:hypothetical protein
MMKQDPSKDDTSSDDEAPPRRLCLGKVGEVSSTASGSLLMMHARKIWEDRKQADEYDDEYAEWDGNI